MSAPLIVTAELGAADQAEFEGLRRRYFPPDRNQLAAHLTMFHAVPAFLESELRQRLGAIAAEQPPFHAMLAGVMDLGGGVALSIVSDDLDAIRDDLADAFRGSLTAQDAQGWRPHVTIQNKVPRHVALATMAALDIAPRPVAVAGLAFHFYEGGPWRLGQRYPFRGR